MSRTKKWAIFLLICCVMSVACSSSPSGIDKRKFDRIGSAAQQVKRATMSGDYQAFSSALQGLLAEITALKDKVRTDEEKDLLNNFSNLYSIYYDGFILWKYKIEFTRYGFVPSNLIYVGQDIEPIVTKYRIPTEVHVYAPTQQSWKSIPVESLQLIWTNADSQLQIISNILNYDQPAERRRN
jgi:hypothetical protein